MADWRPPTPNSSPPPYIPGQYYPFPPQTGYYGYEYQQQWQMNPYMAVPQQYNPYYLGPGQEYAGLINPPAQPHQVYPQYYDHTLVQEKVSV